MYKPFNDLDDLSKSDIFRPHEISVLKLRLKMDGERKRTLEEIGQLFGVSKERIRQIEAKALRKLNHPDVYIRLNENFKYCIDNLIYRKKALSEKKEV